VDQPQHHTGGLKGIVYVLSISGLIINNLKTEGIPPRCKHAWYPA
jgi:hypothetical protein